MGGWLFRWEVGRGGEGLDWLFRWEVGDWLFRWEVGDWLFRWEVVGEGLVIWLVIGFLVQTGDGELKSTRMYSSALRVSN